MGSALAIDLGLASAAEARGEGGKETIEFGSLEKLVEQLFARWAELEQKQLYARSMTARFIVSVKARGHRTCE